MQRNKLEGLILAMLLLWVSYIADAAVVKAKSTGMPPAPVTPTVMQASSVIKIAYLSQVVQSSSAVAPYYQIAIAQEGVAGAKLAIIDNNTTGQFTHQQFELKVLSIAATEDVPENIRLLVGQGYEQIILDVPPEKLVSLMQSELKDSATFYDISTVDDALRAATCRSNLVHMQPGRAMRADALAQYLAKKRWKNLFLLVGPDENDRRFAAALKRSTQRFGLKWVGEKVWAHAFDSRHTPESEIPVLTQGLDYDVLLVADESGQFGALLPYRTWLPRPVAGTQGLMAKAWDVSLESWGALQLQRRFHEQAGYWMQDKDYASWLAVRAIGEAVSRTHSIQRDIIQSYLRGSSFALAGFKGVPLSFRSWDGQLRQPVLLAAEQQLIAVAPVEGFLHPKNELDTLGYDEMEHACHAAP